MDNSFSRFVKFFPFGKKFPLLLLQSPWFTGLYFLWSCWVLVFPFHRSWVFCPRILLYFNLISILSMKPEFLSSTCSSLLEWLSTQFFICFKKLFSQDFCWILFSGVFYIFVKLLFPIFCCLLYFICIFLT
jgi:hypothetical protein